MMYKKARNHFAVFTMIAASLTLVSSCGDSNRNKNEQKETGFNFSTIDSLIGNYELDEALIQIQSQSGLERSDSVKLNYYVKFINRISDIKSQLKESDKEVFIQKTIDFQEGNYRDTRLFVDNIYGEKIYHGKNFINAEIGLLTKPQMLVLTCSYDDRFYHHVFTEIAIKMDDKTITLAKGSPANGFNESGELKTRPFEFELSDKQTQRIAGSDNAKLVFTTAVTHFDRAYLNGTIWDVKGGEPIKYNDVSLFKERKARTLEKGEVKTFEIEVKKRFRERLKQLFEIHQILERNKVKPA
ncbi:MAG: hypothetical protein MI810_00660 [Flavobacteriales bacterium]|nr:hypothetical protein [Flavobacteriales bacterium]